jgi:hypothetical protein
MRKFGEPAEPLRNTQNGRQCGRAVAHFVGWKAHSMLAQDGETGEHDYT